MCYTSSPILKLTKSPLNLAHGTVPKTEKLGIQKTQPACSK